MARYDENILQIFADSLYSEARSIVWKTAVKYGFLSLLFGIIAVPIALKLAGITPSGLLLIPVSCIVALGTAVGISAGQARAFELKLEAQRILVLAQIEHNTRVNVRELEPIGLPD